MFTFSARYNQKPEANFKIVFFYCKGIKERLLKNCIQTVVMIEKNFALRVSSEVLLRQTPKKSFFFLKSRFSYKIISNQFNFSMNFIKVCSVQFFFKLASCLLNLIFTFFRFYSSLQIHLLSPREKSFQIFIWKNHSSGLAKFYQQESN